MGNCCCLKRRGALTDDVEEIELQNATNKEVICRGGLTGKDVSMVLDGGCYKVSGGAGTALGSCALDCDTAFWQVRVGNKPEKICIGVKRFNTKKQNNTSLGGQLESSDSLVASPSDTESPSWMFKGAPNVTLKTGDIVGVYWDQTDLPMLSFSVNGEDVPEAAIMRIRPAIDIYPAVSVDTDASCELIFDANYFVGQPKSPKFKMIICSTSLI